MLKKPYDLLFSCVLALLLLVNASAKAQHEPSNQTDAKGLKQGKWKKTDNSGNVVYEGQFENNTPVGTFKYFYPNGVLQSLVTHTSKGSMRVVMYHKNGKKLAEGAYKSQKKDGEWTYYNEAEHPNAVEFYENGSPKGIWKKYYDNGSIHEECYYEKGMKQGILKQYFENGDIKLSISFDKGMMNGSTKFYFTNGKILQQGAYVQDVKDGIWTTYKESGQKESEIEYKKGKVVREVFYDKKLEKELKGNPPPIKSTEMQ